MGTDKDYFPYAYTPPKKIPRYMRYRAEGRRPLDCAIHGISYLRKQMRKLRIAPKEEIVHFRQQRRLLKMLAAKKPVDSDAQLAMVGDIMWIADGWSTFLSDEVLDYLNAHNVVVGNLETVISSSFRVSRPFPEFAWFNSDPALLTSFQRPDGRNTFSALSIANNHTLDYRDRGCQDLMRFLDEQGIAHSGVRQRPHQPAYATFTVNGIKIGFVAATWGLNDRRRLLASSLTVNTADGLAADCEHGVDLSCITLALEAMEAEGVDFKIVCLHWGFEFELFPTPRTMQVARDIVKAGADVVMGSHPHVQQPAEVAFVNGYERRYEKQAAGLDALCQPTGCILESEIGGARKALILYSLGNFTTAMSTFLCRVGLIQTLHLHRDPTTGHVDWSAPHGRLVYNVPPEQTSCGRRLVFLADWLRTLPSNERTSKHIQRDLRHLRRSIIVAR